MHQPPATSTDAPPATAGSPSSPIIEVRADPASQPVPPFASAPLASAPLASAPLASAPLASAPPVSASPPSQPAPGELVTAPEATPSTTPPRARTSERLASQKKKKRAADALADIRRQKQRLSLRKEEAAAASARASAVALGPASRAPSQPTCQDGASAELIEQPATADSGAPRRSSSGTTTSRPRPAPSRPALAPAPALGAVSVEPPSRPTTSTIPSVATPPASTAPPQSPRDGDGQLLVASGEPPQPTESDARLRRSAQPPTPSEQRAQPPSGLRQQTPPASRPSDRAAALHLSDATAPSPSEDSQARPALPLDDPRPGFDLNSFLRDFHDSGASTSEPTRASAAGASIRRTSIADTTGPRLPAVQPVAAPTSARADQLRSTLNQLIYLLQPPSYTAASSTADPPVALPQRPLASLAATWTIPNHRGTLPPDAVLALRAEHFPPPARNQRARGDFVPAAVHTLAAHRLYPYLLSQAGEHETPMSFVNRMRMLDCVTFDDTPAVLAATAGARFGRYGVSIMHYRRADRQAQLAAASAGTNLAHDFGPTAAPPPAPPCASYFDLLSAIQGLLTFAHAEWHEVMSRPLHRLREFIVANMDADPAHTPQRVQRTLHEVNRHLGAVYVHLSNGSPYWWRDFSAAASRIEFNSVAWAMALQELSSVSVPRLPASPRPATAPSDPTRNNRRTDSGHSPRTRPGGIPASVRALIPRNAAGEEPCLRFFGGGGCRGGAGDTCIVPGRTHAWPGDLPAALQAFIARRFGRRNHHDRPRR